MSGKPGDDRLRVEAWEIELARRIAGSFRPGDEDLKAELFKRLAEIKRKDLSGIRQWQAFLAQSLYNAAKNFFRQEDRRRRAVRLSIGGEEGDEDRPSFPEARLIAPGEPIEADLKLREVWALLTPDMRQLAQLLFEEEGKISSVAKRLRRPRKTVEYWIQKLRAHLKDHGLE